MKARAGSSVRFAQRRVALVLIGALLASASALQSEPAAGADWAHPKIVRLTRGDRTAPRTYRIAAWFASPAAREQGLQGFRPLGPGEIAVFAYPAPTETTFWMGSVSYALDIIFVDPQRRVVQVYAGCAPGSRAFFPSAQKIRWVLETAAGADIRVNDRVVFPPP